MNRTKTSVLVDLYLNTRKSTTNNNHKYIIDIVMLDDNKERVEQVKVN